MLLKYLFSIRTYYKKCKFTRGFTLIELMIVITIIGILASFITVSTRKALDRAKIAKTLAWDSSLNSSLGADCVGDWEFDTGQGNIARDYSGNGNDGTIYGATWTDDTPNHSLGKALSFNGSSDYVDCGKNIIGGTDPFTLEAWIKTKTLSKYSGAVSIGTSASGHSAYIGTVARAQVGTSYSIGGGFYGRNYGSGVKTTNEWVHVVMTFSGGTNGTAKIYVNGEEKVTDVYTPSLSVGGYRRIGRIGSDTSYNFYGVIDEVRIYSKALDTAEIKEHYLAGLKRRKIRT